MTTSQKNQKSPSSHMKKKPLKKTFKKQGRDIVRDWKRLLIIGGSGIIIVIGIHIAMFFAIQEGILFGENLNVERPPSAELDEERLNTVLQKMEQRNIQDRQLQTTPPALRVNTNVDIENGG